MQAIFFPYKNPLPLVVKRAKYFRSESSHVTYQIKRNGAKSTIQAHILSLQTLSASGVGVKDQNIFSRNSHVAYQIKGN